MVIGVSRCIIPPCRRIFRTQALWFSDIVAPTPANLIGPEYSFFTREEVRILTDVLTGEHSAAKDNKPDTVYEKAVSLGFDSPGALFLLHCLSKKPESLGKKLLTNTIRRIEEEYFSGDQDWLHPSSPYSLLVVETGLADKETAGSFRALVHSLPTECKALLMGFSEELSPAKRLPKLTPLDIQGKWQTRDPVDMETVEREHYLKTGQVLRTRYVKAEPSPIPVGSRLRQILGMEFLERMDDLTVDDFVRFGSALLTAPKNGVFHRDLKFDAQFAMCKKILGMRHEEVGRYILPLSLIISTFESNLEAPSRVWNRSIIPALRKGLGSVDIVPPMYGDLNEASRWALVASSIMSSGRVKVTPRLMSYLEPKFSNHMSLISPRIVQRLVNGYTVAGFASPII